jgi:hypothetical protein
LVEKAWESSARTLSHFSANDALEKEVITVWKGSQNLLLGGIIWRGWGGVNERPGIARPSFLLAERARWDGARPMRAVKDSLPTPYGELTGLARRPQFGKLSSLSSPTLLIPRAKISSLLIPSPCAATASHPIQRKRIVSCL